MSSFSYDFSVLGGDARQVFLAEMLAESGRSLCHYALASQPNNCSSVSEHVSIVREAPSLEEACIHSGSVICPFPFTKNGADVSVENSIYRFSIQTLLHLLRPGQSLFAGGIPPSFKKEAAENNVAVFDYADDISLPVYNSISTAEGAICEAILHSPFNLHKSRCAVLGFGKCGHSIVYRLKGLSANVSVFTDNAEESARASVIADKSFPLKSLSDHAGDFRFIFNTVPAQFINEDDREQKLFTEIRHAFWHIYGSLLDIEIHTTSIDVCYTFFPIAICYSNASRANHRLLLRKNLSRQSMRRSYTILTRSSFHYIYVYVRFPIGSRSTLHILPVYRSRLYLQRPC